jgi:endonuclease/exonuclease/phosphatase family metal-dependent hydrolase
MAIHEYERMHCTPTKIASHAISAVVFACSAAPVNAQWDPANGQWGKSDDSHLRVMTWNVGDAICRTADKADDGGSWNAIARILADLRPDILIVQEAGDNSGNNTGSGRDSVSQMTTTFELLIHGGNDPFEGGPVVNYVQLFSPSYDLPFIYVSNDNSDGFNRSVILSRFPFADLNGDGVSRYDNFVILGSPDYAAGGNGGIRGFQHAEIDLPDDVYGGDLVIGNSHLKAFGDPSDLAQRLNAARNIAYYIDHQYNGAGTGAPDPDNAIAGTSPTSVLGDDDIVIWGGDWNEDESSNDRRGPAEWMTRAAQDSGSDGTDADRSDAVYDSASNPLGDETATRGAQKLDYLAHQDSRATLVREFIFQTTADNMADALPPAVDDFWFIGTAASSRASDHIPVIVDLQLAAAAGPCIADFDQSGTVNIIDVVTFVSVWNASDPLADFDNNGILNILDVVGFISLWNQGCP